MDSEKDIIINENSAEPLPDGLFAELRKDILTGRLKDGSKLSESFICKRYKVSRTPAREALIRLEEGGLVRSIPNRGAFVTGLSGSDISGLFDIRAMHEVKATELAVLRMGSEDIGHLSEVFGFMELYTLKEDTEKVVSFSRRFHGIIYEGCGDRFLHNDLNKYCTYLTYSMPDVLYTNDQLKDILEEHREIFRAIENGDVAAGRRAMEYHMRESKKRLNRI